MSNKRESIFHRKDMDLNAIIEKSESFSLRKHDRATTVGILRGIDFGLDQDLLLKKFNYRGFFDFLIHKYLNDRAERLWNISVRLYEKGLPVPKPVDYEKLSFQQKASFYISEVIENADNLSRIYRDGLLKGNGELVQSLASALAGWHLKGAVHGDLKWPNILVQQNGDTYAIFFIDLDQARLYDAPSRKGIIKDLKRFYRFSLETGAEEWVEKEFFPAYTALIPDAIKKDIIRTDIRIMALREWQKKGSKRL